MPDKMNSKNKAISLLTNYKYSIISALILCFLVMLANRFIFSITLIINAISIIWLFNILAKIKFKYAFAFIILLAAMLGFNAYFILVYHGFISMDAIASILETNIVESKSMIKNNFIAGAIIFICTFFLTFKSIQELKNSAISLKVSVAIILIYTFAFIPALTYRRIKMWVLPSDLELGTLDVAQVYTNLYAPLIFGNLVSATSYCKEQYQMKQYKNNNKTLPEGIALDKEKATPDKIFLVIGESSLRDNYSLYGYPVRTTPFLDSLQASTVRMEVLDGISPAPITREALQIILSFATPADSKPFFTHNNIINMANEAGYETYWISNSPQMGFLNTYVSYIADEANHTFYNNGNIEIEDFNLVPPLRKSYKKGEKQFFALHLMGSHQDYSDKYDKTDEEALPGGGTAINHYNRSIHHTDRVLREIYNIAKQEDSFLIYYFSDHAEIIGLGHGMWLRGAEQHRVPCIIISGTEAPEGSIAAKYINPATSLINISGSVYFLAEYMGFQIPERYIEQSITDGEKVRIASDGTTIPYAELGDALKKD